MIGSVLANLGLGAVNNVMSEWHADQAFKRQKELMNMQQRMNNANAVNAYSQQVEGARMAGLNPAMLNGQQPAVQSVSQGSAPKGENVELNPADMLLMAQKENLEANTEKTEAEAKAQEKANDITDTANDSVVQGVVQDLSKEYEDLEQSLAKLKPDTVEYNKVQGRMHQISKMLDKVNDPSFKGALGIVKGTEAARENTKHRMGILNEYLNGRISNSVAEKELGNGTIDALARMPKLTRQKLSADIDAVKQQIAESESREELNDKTVEELTAKITQIGQEILQQRVNDPNLIKELFGVDSKEWKNYTDTEWRKFGFEVGKTIVTGGALLATGSVTGKAAGSAIKGAKNGMEKFDQYIQEGKKVREAWESMPPYSGFPQGQNSGSSGVQSMKKNKK